MARLFDEIILNPKYNKPPSNTVCIDANDVFKYYFQVNPKEDYDVDRDMPNLAPPFETFFIEGKCPKWINLSGKKVEPHQNSIKMGTLFVAKKISAIEKEKLFKKGLVFAIDSNWLIAATLLYNTGKTIAPFGTWLFGITENGKWVRSKDSKKCLSAFSPHNDSVKEWFTRTKDRDEQARTIGLLDPFLLTISFLHCKKQTKLIEHVPPEKVQRKRARRNKPPLTKYYTLDIEPLKEILRTEGRVHEVGLPKALHICRGHFKDYSQGKGLFGKYKGLYWWDSHIRGNEDVGTVVKDYAVKLPEVEGFN